MKKSQSTRASAILRQQRRDAATVRHRKRGIVDTGSHLLTDGMRAALA